MKHCCKQMKVVSTLNCEHHSTKYECPDVLIAYNDRFDEYGIIIHDGGSSMISIEYCPFCGYQLPESKRELWFQKLEKLGYNDPAEQKIPQDFETDAWFRK